MADQADQMTGSSLEFEIRSQLQRYLRGDISIETFAARFTELLWRTEGDLAAEDLAYAIELRLDEYSSGHWSEAELRDLLAPVAATHIIRTGRDRVTSTTGTAAAFMREDVFISLGESFAGTAHDTAHA